MTGICNLVSRTVSLHQPDWTSAFAGGLASAANSNEAALAHPEEVELIAKAVAYTQTYRTFHRSAEGGTLLPSLVSCGTACLYVVQWQ